MDNTPIVRATLGGTVCNVACRLHIPINAFDLICCYRVEITGWWSISSTMVSVQCDPDAAAWSVVSG